MKIVFRMKRPVLLFSQVFVVLSSLREGESSEKSLPIRYALSPVYLQYLENAETRIYTLLKSKIWTAADEQEAAIQRYLSEYEGSIGNSLNQCARNTEASLGNNICHEHVVSSNPILSLQMINRFVKHFRKSKIFPTVLNESIGVELIPREKEVEITMEALLRLQHFYDLDAYELSSGILHGIHTNASLTVQECYNLGKFAQENEYFTLALQWFDVVLYKLKQSSVNVDSSMTVLNKKTIIKSIKQTISQHNEDHKENLDDGDMYSFKTPIHSTNYSTIAHLSMRKQLVEKLTGKFYDLNHPEYFQAVEANMMALCEGKITQSEKIKARLKCILDTSRHPYWIINPLKVEVLSETPSIVRFYDIFSDKWISSLKNMSYSLLKRAPQPRNTTPRTATYAWFEDSTIPEIPVSKVVELITGLKVVGWPASEQLQVAAYAFGAHVSSHWDWLSEDSNGKVMGDPKYLQMGNRMLTFLAYLNEVEIGGQTAFPFLGISVKPVKNSAVLWFNSLRNGTLDSNTLHASCPVIEGEKWIATKWAHLNENILRRPCAMSSES